MLNLIHKICNLLFECNFNDLSTNSYKPVSTYVNGVNIISYICRTTCDCVYYISVIRCQYLSNNNNNNHIDENKRETKKMNTNSPVSLV